MTSGGASNCSTCGETKPLGAFYLHLGIPMATCKECWKQQVREARHRNPRVREYDRERSKQPHRVANATRVTREWRAKHPGRSAAQSKAARLALNVPLLCEGCNLRKRLEKHHPDYSKPLLVVWLC